MSARKPILLSIEFTSLFIALPLALFALRNEFRTLVIVTILTFGAGCTIALIADKDFDRSRFWNADGLKREFRRLVQVLLLLSVVPVLYLLFFERDLFFRFPRRATLTWLIVLLLYPVLSAFPQEIIFRTFFFHRYRPLFPTQTVMIAASALAFGVAHLFLANWIAPIFATAGGALFAFTYARSNSTLAAGVEHALWGNLLFTTGLGWYFYAGSIGMG